MGRANVVGNFKSPVIIEQTRQLIKYLKNNGGISESIKIFEFLNESDHFYDICAMLVGANVLEEMHENDKTLLKLKCNAPKSTVEVQTGHERVCGIIEMNKKNKQRIIHCRHCKKQYPLHNWHIYTAHFHQKHMDHLQIYHMNNLKLPLNTCAWKTKQSNTATQVNNILSNTTDAITANCTRTIAEANIANLSTINLRPESQHKPLKRTQVMNANVGPELKRLRNAVPTIERTVSTSNNTDKEPTISKQSKLRLTQFPVTVSEFLKTQRDRLQSSESAKQSVENELETLATTNSEQQVHFTLNKSPQLAAKTITFNELKPTHLPAQPSVAVTNVPSESNEHMKINIGKLPAELCKTNTIVYLNATSANSVGHFSKAQRNPSNSNVENGVDSAETILPDSQPSEQSNDTSNAPVDYEMIIPRFPVSETQAHRTTTDKTTDSIKKGNEIIRKEIEPAKSNIIYIAHPQYVEPAPPLKMPLQFIHVKPKTIATTTANMSTPTTVKTFTNSKLNTIQTIPRRKYPIIQPKPTTSDNYKNELRITTSTTNHNVVKSKETRSTASFMTNLPITSKKIKYATRKRPIASLKRNILSVNAQGVKRVAPAVSSASKNSKIQWNAKSVYDSLKEHQQNLRESPRIPAPKTRSEIFYTQRIKEGTPLYINLKEPKSPSDNSEPLNETQITISNPTKSPEQSFYINLKEPESPSDNGENEPQNASPEKNNVPTKSVEPQRVTSICKIPSGITIKRVPRSVCASTTNSGSKNIPPNDSLTSNGRKGSLSKSQIVENTEILPIEIFNVQSIKNSIHDSSIVNDDSHFEFVSSGGINGRNKNESSFMRFDYSDDECVDDDDYDYNNNDDYDYNNDEDDYNGEDDYDNDKDDYDEEEDDYSNDEDDYNNGDNYNNKEDDYNNEEDDYDNDEHYNNDEDDYNNDEEDYNNDKDNYNNYGDDNNNDKDDYNNADSVSNMRFEYSDDNDDGYTIEL